LDNAWRDPVRRFKLGLTDQEKEKNLIGYFDHVFELKRRHPTDSVVGYAISRLEGESLGSGSWKIAEALLLQAMSVEPDAIQQVAVAFAKAYSNRMSISTDDLAQGLSLVIRRHAPLNHGFEVAWALWMALSFGCSIVDPDANQRLGAMADPAVALLALDAQQRGLLPSLDVTGWERLMTAEQLEGEHWLLAYEASVKGWLPTFGGGDHIAAHTSFEFMRQNNVSFYTRVRTPTKASIAEMPTWRPGYGDVSSEDDDDFLSIFADLL
jgi:hypothetical protein